MNVYTDGKNSHNVSLYHNIMDFNITEKSLTSTSINYYGLVYTSLLLVIGLPGNILVFFVYSKKTRKNSTTIFILVLAIFDLINCIATLPTEIVMLLNPFVFHIGPVCKMSRFTTYTCNSAAAVILAAIAVDRYKRVCKPHGKQFTLQKSKRIALFSLSLACSVTWPSLVIYGPRTIHVWTGNKNMTRQICEIDDDYVVTVYPLIYYSYMCFSTCGIYFILLASYISIVLKMVRRRNFSSLISARLLSQRGVPNIQIEQPSSHVHETNAIQVTSVHSSTRSLNVCCRTDESNIYQYEPASKVKHGPFLQVEEQKLNQDLEGNGTLDEEPKFAQGDSRQKKSEFLNHVNVDGLGPNLDNNDSVFQESNGSCNDNLITVRPTNRLCRQNNNITQQSKDSQKDSRKKVIKSLSLDVPPERYSIQKTSSLDEATERSHSKRSSPSSGSPSPCVSSRAQSLTGEISLKGSNKSRMRSSKRSLRTHRLGKTTLMLLIVTIVYIVSFLPFLGVVIQRSISPMIPLVYDGEFDMVYEALYRSYLLNCAINPVIYSFFNANFRKDCSAACRRMKLF